MSIFEIPESPMTPRPRRLRSREMSTQDDSAFLAAMSIGIPYMAPRKLEEIPPIRDLPTLTPEQLAEANYTQGIC